MFQEKLKASLLHLLFSLLLVGLIIGSVLFFFFPKLFINVSDFKEVASIIISVDLILGPLLTFVVFQRGKKSLKFDLSIIAAIQLIALLYGSYALYQIHPLYVTFNVDRFTMISARDAEPEKALYEEYKVSKLSSAKLAFAKMPKESDKRNEVLLTAALGGGDLDMREEYYEPYEQHINEIISKAIDNETILESSKKDKKIGEFLIKNNNLSNLAFFPINTTKKDAIIVLDRKTALPVATIDSDPWKLTKK